MRSDIFKRHLYDNELTVYVIWNQALAKTIEQDYTIFYDQCSEYLQDKMKNSKKVANIQAT